MEATATLAKTAKGVDEVTRHAHGLPNKLRSLLIMVDGRATVGALISRFGEGSETESKLRFLIDRGFVEKASGWDPELLKQIETHFAHFVGPIAKVMVHRAQKQTSDIEELYAKLAEEIEQPDDRLTFTKTRPLLRKHDAPKSAHTEEPHRRLKEFEAGFGRVVKPTAAAISQVAEQHGNYYKPSTMFASSNDRLAFMLTRNQLRAALLKRALPRRHAPLLGEIEHHFARFMGSNAKRIVRLAVKQTTYVDELYAMLSKMLDSPHDRLAFMSTRNQLWAARSMEALPRPHGQSAPDPRNHPSGLDRALLGEIEHHFARFMGSSAKRIVRLAVKRTPYVDDLYAMLSKMLDSPRDRLAFMGTRDELQVVLRERAEAKG
jgi:hypothetical protein